MDRLWSPWRSEYLASGGGDPAICVFCKLRDEPDKDKENFVVHRGTANFVVLNRYPYISGHLLVVPYEHIAELDTVKKTTSDELMDLTKQCQTVLREVYRPEGFNVGMNLGRAAGAGIADHIHIHVLPRWGGDTNFMTSVGESRVLPEDLATTYEKVRQKF